ncbi:MAG: 4-hydroxythreonine-4-phosphate dehydrogenase PdxA [Elusimicrobiaceae bacterium]|nr:4-hydroxythreonine-4-phosphate dehydrogenase PdxA [Elusimicrobiaceae bacterium]
MPAKPIIAVTTGDPCGIGPEITLKAARSPRVRRECRLVITGVLPAGAELAEEQEFIDLSGYARKLGPDRDYRTGRPSRKGGLLSFKAVELATQAVLNGKASAIVTAPVSKQSWQKAGLPYTGHTEFFEKYCQSPGAAMCFAKGPVRVMTVTNHLPLKAVARELDARLIVSKTLKFAAALKEEGLHNPEIGIGALNPHAGDAGRLGGEEISVIAPAVAALRRKGVKASGPLPADALWAAHLTGRFDAIVVPYHDCALIPLKILNGPAAVHFTAGLPIIRTSPAHGTAFDIAGKTIACPASMIAAVLLAAKTARIKKKEAAE